MNGQPRVMLLIDADNVSVGVMEQAVAALLREHGALHVRRAYCTAESAAKHQAVFKRLGIRPMVNLAAGKNSTDIAMAVDALDLAGAERPDIVAIASSDSDFAPLVLRLREKGCRVVGIGQEGKTGDETRAVYDAFTVFGHKPPHPAPHPAPPPARAAAPEPAKPSPAPAPAPTPRKAAAKKTAAPKAAAKKTATRKPAAKSAGASKPAAKGARDAKDAGAERTQAPVAPQPAAPAAPADAAAAPAPDKARQILMALPELVRGDTVELRVAAERLRAAGLLSRSGASTKVFGAFPERFELLPAANPNKVRLRT